jgi:hypothetical protein
MSLIVRLEGVHIALVEEVAHDAAARPLDGLYRRQAIGLNPIVDGAKGNVKILRYLCSGHGLFLFLWCFLAVHVCPYTLIHLFAYL